jgi:hypothetical protein
MSINATIRSEADKLSLRHLMSLFRSFHLAFTHPQKSTAIPSRTQSP